MVTNPGYPLYGARGIVVCERWRGSFEAFFQDMGPKPSRAHSIDRMDNDGNYEPENCRWATPLEQQRNQRSNLRLTYKGKTMTAIELSETTGVPYARLLFRIKRGWSVESAVEEPLRSRTPLPGTPQWDEWKARLKLRRKRSYDETETR